MPIVTSTALSVPTFASACQYVAIGLYCKMSLYCKVMLAPGWWSPPPPRQDLDAREDLVVVVVVVVAAAVVLNRCPPRVPLGCARRSRCPPRGCHWVQSVPLKIPCRPPCGCPRRWDQRDPEVGRREAEFQELDGQVPARQRRFLRPGVPEVLWQRAVSPFNKLRVVFIELPMDLMDSILEKSRASACHTSARTRKLASTQTSSRWL